MLSRRRRPLPVLVAAVSVALAFLPATGDELVRMVRPFLGDGADEGVLTNLYNPSSITAGHDGTIYFVDEHRNRIMRVRPGGTVELYAGNGDTHGPDADGDGGPATAASLHSPRGVAADQAGNVYIADTHHDRVRRVDPEGIIHAFAGMPLTGGFAGDGGPAVEAQLSIPWGVWPDAFGNVFIADTGNNRIRKVTPGGIITTIAGTGEFGDAGDGGPALNASFASISGMTGNADGNLFVTTNHSNVRRIDASAGTVTHVAGSGHSGYSVDGSPAATSALNAPLGLDVVPDGLLVAEAGNNLIRRIGSDGTITTVAGRRSPGFSGDGGPAAGSRLRQPMDVSVGPAGDLLIADAGNHRIRVVAPDASIRSLDATAPICCLDDGAAPALVRPNEPKGMALAPDGTVYIADAGNHRVLAVAPSGQTRRVAGIGLPGYGGDGGPAVAASLDYPQAVAVDSAGNVYIADSGNSLVRKVDPAGIVSTVAGRPGESSYAEPNGVATSVPLGLPLSLLVEADGSLLIGDAGGGYIERLAPDGTISVLLGDGVKWFGIFCISESGEVPASEETLCSPSALLRDSHGALLFSDFGGGVRRLDADGIVRPVAGPGNCRVNTGVALEVCGSAGFGDGGPATLATLNSPAQLALAPDGTLLIADMGSRRIRAVGTDGRIRSIAGYGYYLDPTETVGTREAFQRDVPAPLAGLDNPWGLLLLPDGRIVFSEFNGRRIRVLDASSTTGF